MKKFEVFLPYPQTLVYIIEAETAEQALEKAETPGAIENHSLGGLMVREVREIKEKSENE